MDRATTKGWRERKRGTSGPREPFSASVPRASEAFSASVPRASEAFSASVPRVSEPARVDEVSGAELDSLLERRDQALRSVAASAGNARPKISPAGSREVSAEPKPRTLANRRAPVSVALVERFERTITHRTLGSADALPQTTQAQREAFGGGEPAASPGTLLKVQGQGTRTYVEQRKIWEDRWKAAVESLRSRKAEPPAAAPLPPVPEPRSLKRAHSTIAGSTRVSTEPRDRESIDRTESAFPTSARDTKGVLAPPEMGVLDRFDPRAPDSALPAVGSQALRSQASLDASVAHQGIETPVQNFPPRSRQSRQRTKAQDRSREFDSVDLPKAASVGTKQVRSTPPARTGAVTDDSIGSKTSTEGSTAENEVTLPSVHEILRIHAKKTSVVNEPKNTRSSQPSKRSVRSLPTQSQEPSVFVLPGFLPVWIIGFALALPLAAAGIGLAWTWGKDAESTGAAADRLWSRGVELAAAEDLKPLVEQAEVKTGWWQTTSMHLYIWAMANERSAFAGDQSGWSTARALLAEARRASPAHAWHRYILARLSEGDSRPEAAAECLGLARDVDSLAWSAHCLREQGKAKAAADLYRHAIGLACRLDPANEPMRLVNGNDQLRRYRLPRESSLDAVLRDLLRQAKAESTEWSAALPEEPIAWLAAGRLLQEQSNPEHIRVLKHAYILAEAQVSAGGPSAVERAIAIAVSAEVLALEGELEGSRVRYRRAIDLVSIDLIRRSWWMNVADISVRLGDLSTAKLAWESARGDELSDPIARRSEVLQLATIAARIPSASNDPETNATPRTANELRSKIGHSREDVPDPQHIRE